MFETFLSAFPIVKGFIRIFIQDEYENEHVIFLPWTAQDSEYIACDILNSTGAEFTSSAIIDNTYHCVYSFGGVNAYISIS